jgi:hypothetical protein
MATINFLAGKIVSLKDDGTINAGGKVYWYVADGAYSTAITTYSDQALATPNANPLVLDSSGRGKAYFSGNADIKITTSADVTIYTERNISPQNVKTVYTKATNFTIDSTYIDSIVETTASLTATLSSASTLGSGFQVAIINTSASSVTLARANAGDTINGTAANITIPANSASTITVNFGTTGFITNTIGYPVSIANGGTNATTAAAARASLAVGGLADINTWTGAQALSASRPNYLFVETDASADNGKWYFDVEGGVFNLKTLNDAQSVAENCFSVTRSGTTVSTLTLGGTTVAVTNALTVGGTLGVTGLTTLTGGQLKFPATQVPSADVNTLDDYEEGTWTPAVGGTATYNEQIGRYVKIGKTVYIFAILGVNVLGTGSTTVVSGLPFAVADFSSITGTSGNLDVTRWSSIATAAVHVSAVVGSATSSVTFGATAAAATSSGGSAVFGNSALVHLSGFYFIS